MTMLASWVGVDTHGTASAYIVSDSRISWNNNSNFDHGKKVFASKNYPEIFGYAGDVLFPSIVLQQIIEMIDADILFERHNYCHEKNKIIFDKLSYELNKYPIDNSTKNFEILHISRDTIVKSSHEFMQESQGKIIDANLKYPHYYAFLLSFNNGKWRREEIKVPAKSEVLCILGSGKSEFIKNYSRYQDGLNKDTSRNVYHCFIDTLINIQDPFCGGAPQLVGIYRKPGVYGKYFGVIYNGKRYFAGSEVPNNSNYNNVGWRNENFEICDGRDKKIVEGAEVQPDFLRRK